MQEERTNILLVEDREADAELAILALESHKLINNIKWVRDGQEALDFLFSEGAFKDRKNTINPQLILLDLKMPKMDGLEVLKHIRADERTRRIPVVVLTTSREDKDLKEAYELGVNSYIVKPVEFESFTKSVKELGFYWLLLNEPAE